MIVITTETRDITAGESTAREVACPLCNHTGSIRFTFHHKQTWNAVFKMRIAGVVGSAGCTACNSYILPRQWSDQMHKFYQDNKARFYARASFGLSWPFLSLLGIIALVIAGAWISSRINSRYGSNYALDRKSIAQSVAKARPGSIFMVKSHVRDLVSANAMGSLDDYTLLRVVTVDGEKITARLHKSVSQDPLTPFTNSIKGEDDSDFQSDTVTLLRHHAHYDYDNGFDKILPNGRPAPHAQNEILSYEVVRIIDEP
jgi:hypothetical protein